MHRANREEADLTSRTRAHTDNTKPLHHSPAETHPHTILKAINTSIRWYHLDREAAPLSEHIASAVGENGIDKGVL